MAYFGKKTAFAAAAAGCFAAGYYGAKAFEKYCMSTQRAPSPPTPAAPVNAVQTREEEVGNPSF